MNNYSYIESLLVRLLSILVGVFTDSEINEVREFIDAGEYGLALETLIDIIDEESKSIPHDVVTLATQLAVAMELDDSVVKARLSGFVSQN